MYFVYYKPKHTLQYNLETTKETTKETTNKKDDFNDTMTINNYINSKMDELEKEKDELSEKKLDSDFKGNHNYLDSASDNLFNKYQRFTQNFIKHNEGIQNDIDTSSITTIPDNIKYIKNNNENYNYAKINEFYEIYNKNFTPEVPPVINKHEHFLSTTSPETFIGTYSVIPYQYKNFNKVNIVISKYSPPITNNIFIEQQSTNKIYNTEADTHTMGFYIDDFLILEYKIDFYNIKSRCNKDSCPDETSLADNENNIKGITIEIKEKIELLVKSTKIINEIEIENIKHILFNLGFKINSKLHLFLVKKRFDTRYITPNIDGKKEIIEYQRSNDDLYRIYSTNGTTLLHIKKKQDIDKPFQSLLN